VTINTDNVSALELHFLHLGTYLETCCGLRVGVALVDGTLSKLYLAPYADADALRDTASRMHSMASSLTALADAQGHAIN
jgi:hypothetical protein